MLSFENGAWDELELRDDQYTALEEECKRMNLSRDVLCGHWRVTIESIGARFRCRGPWNYRVYAETAILGEDDPGVYEQMLVRDFPSLLQLLALLRAADIELAPPSAKAPEAPEAPEQS